MADEGEWTNSHDITADETRYLDFNVITNLEVKGYTEESKYYYKTNDNVFLKT